jgi:hypothetical protein
MDWKKIKKPFENDSEVILTPEEFMKRIRVGTIFWSITCFISKPNTIEEYQLISDYEDKKVFDEKMIFADFLINKRFVSKESVRDFFWGHKCVTLSKEKANEVFEKLMREFDLNFEWKKEYDIGIQQMVYSDRFHDEM